MHAPTTSGKPRLTGHELMRSLGPGLLWAGAAIGVSHLVQSTRAGASAGLALAGVILAALVLKYPFFEFAPRYAAATRQSLVEGYARIGRWALWLYLAITLVSSVVVDAAVILLTAFLLRVTLGLTWPIAAVAGALYVACAALLAVGRYRLLDAALKLILAALAASTLVAAAVALPRVDVSTLSLIPEIGGDAGVSFAFLLALAGWMPTAIDLSVWSSLWTLAKDRSTGFVTSVEAARADFLVGYIGTGVLAFAFVILGAAVMFGSEAAFSPQGGEFSLQLIDLYEATLGAWTRPFVMVAVLTTMLSTSLTVIDGFPRALERTIRVLREGVPPAPAESAGPPSPEEAGGGRGYWISLACLGVAVTIVLTLFAGSLTTMADFATIVSFLTAPVLGYLNLRVIRGREVPERHRPGKGLVALAWVGIIAMSAFGIVYLIARVS
ncbi:MAG: divalent metal cation transporter [Gemmatimonadota bacterium]